MLPSRPTRPASRQPDGLAVRHEQTKLVHFNRIHDTAGAHSPFYRKTRNSWSLLPPHSLKFLLPPRIIPCSPHPPPAKPIQVAALLSLCQKWAWPLPLASQEYTAEDNKETSMSQLMTKHGLCFLFTNQYMADRVYWESAVLWLILVWIWARGQSPLPAWGKSNHLLLPTPDTNIAISLSLHGNVFTKPVDSTWNAQPIQLVLSGVYYAAMVPERHSQA